MDWDHVLAGLQALTASCRTNAYRTDISIGEQVTLLNVALTFQKAEQCLATILNAAEADDERQHDVLVNAQHWAAR